MQPKSSSSWLDLKNEYYYNLKLLQTAIETTYNSTKEMSRIYSEVMSKSRDSSPETMKKFFDSWSKKSESILDRIPEIREEYKELSDELTEKNLHDFSIKFQKKINENAISELEAYRRTMKSFYETWKDMWPN